MSNSNYEQFLQIIERAKQPIILLAEQAHVDDFVAAFSIASLMAKMQKTITIVTEKGRAPQSLSFLKHTPIIKNDLEHVRKMTLQVDLKQTKVDQLSYEIKENALHIHLTPKSGEWRNEDVSVSTDGYKYDLIITIGLQNLESLGELFTKYSHFIFDTPIINIDHQTTNEHFGQINLVDIRAVSNTEVCFDIMKKIDESLIDQETATHLLTGMISKTKSFRADHVTPRTLKLAGDLIALGARREEIVENLYKTKTVETLRLWGRALARLKSSMKNEIVWSMVTRQDFVSAGAEDVSAEDVVEELMMNSPNAKIGVLFFELPNKQIKAVIQTNHPFDALYLGAPFRASGTKERAIIHPSHKEIVQAEKAVIQHIENQIDHLR